MDLNIPPSPISQIPSDAPLTKQHRHKEYFFLAIAVVVIAAGLLWWQISKYSEESQFDGAVPTFTPNPDAQEMSNIQKDLQDADIGDLDSEFQQINDDLNKL